MATPPDFTSAEGVTYHALRHRHGVDLHAQAETVYLGNDCQASSTLGGRGRWRHADSGSIV